MAISSGRSSLESVLWKHSKCCKVATQLQYTFLNLHRTLERMTGFNNSILPCLKYYKGSLMWSCKIKHTKRCKTKRTWCCWLWSFVQIENSWYRTSAEGEGRVYQAQLYGLKAWVKEQMMEERHTTRKWIAMWCVWILLSLREGKEQNDRDLVYGPTPFTCLCGDMGSASSQSQNLQGCLFRLVPATTYYQSKVCKAFRLHKVGCVRCQPSTLAHLGLSRQHLSYREPSVEVCGLCRQSQAKGLFSRIPMHGKPPQNCNTPRKNYHRIWSEV